MCDLDFKFETNWTQTAVAIEDDRYFRLFDIHSSDFISALHWTDNSGILKLNNALQYVQGEPENRAVCGSLLSPMCVDIEKRSVYETVQFYIWTKDWHVA